MAELKQIRTERKTGNEPFLGMEKTLLDFWAWAHSDIAGNAERGKIAEYIVSCALGSNAEHRVEWDAVDITTPEGIKVEVKSSAYLQTWHQDRFSSIQFGIAPKRAWDSQTNLYSDTAVRSADVYVFCLFACKDANAANPLDLNQWEFYVVPTQILNDKLPNQKTIGLKAVSQLADGCTSYSDLQNKVQHLYRNHKQA